MLRNRFSLLCLLSLMFLAFALITSAAPNAWVKLGHRTVTDRVDHDVIHVGADEGRFSKLQLRASKSNIRVRNVVVIFADGSRQERTENFILLKGEKTPVIDLEGGRRIIREVRFVYDESSIHKRRAKIHLWARR